MYGDWGDMGQIVGTSGWGIALPAGSSYGLSLFGPSVDAPSSRMVSAAEQMVAYAKQGRPLSSYLAAENKERGFMNASRSTAYAYLQDAYWTAAASRILGSAYLIAEAEKFLSSGKLHTNFHTTWASTDSLKIKAAQDEAARTISAVAGARAYSNPSIRAILAILGTTAEPSRVESAQQHQTPTTAPGAIYETGKEIIKTAMSPFHPDPEERPKWFWPAIVGGSALFLLLFLAATRNTSPVVRVVRSGLRGDLSPQMFRRNKRRRKSGRKGRHSR